jgi:hypothetical protein
MQVQEVHTLIILLLHMLTVEMSPLLSDPNNFSFTYMSFIFLFPPLSSSLIFLYFFSKSFSKSLHFY